MKKSLIVPSTVVILIAVGSYFLFFRGSSKKYDFRFDKVSEGDITMYVTATGTLNPVTSVDVGTQVSGIVSKLYADYNSVVKKGQIIAQIDSTFLVQAVNDAKASLDKAKAQYSSNKRNYEREKDLLARGLDSQLNYDAAVTAYESSAADMKSAQASLDRAKINLAYATIYAPISGVVINRAVNAGQTVAASFSSPTLYTIANDLSQMQVLATVDESDIGQISIGQEATFTVDAYPDETFKGTISQIRLNPTTIQNVVNYTVVTDVNNSQFKLMPGMTANIKVLVANTRNVLKVPNMALRFQPPSDLVDSLKLRSMREAFAAKMDQSGSNGSAHASGDPRAQFKALKDSITAAHGGDISDDDLRAEMRKAMAARMGGGLPTVPKSATLYRPPRTTGQFGMDVRYPEFEKSAFVPDHKANRSRVWVLDAQGKLDPVVVWTGVTDGRYTEISGSDLKAGDQVVLGVSSPDASDQARNPFAGGGPPGGGRGGFR